MISSGDEIFLGLHFQSDSGVLVPRSYGEQIFTLLDYLKEDFKTIADVGCGAGHLGVTAALKYPQADIVFIDNSREAVQNTEDNIKLHKVEPRSKIYEEDLEDSDHMKVDLIITNLNFVPDHVERDTIEPASAIYGGPTGMELYENFWNKVKEDGSVPKYILTICLKEQFEKMDEFAMNSGYLFQRRLSYVSMYRKA